MKNNEKTPNNNIAAKIAAIRKSKAHSHYLKSLLLRPNFEKVKNSLYFIDPDKKEYERLELCVCLSWILNSCHDLFKISLIDVVWMDDRTESKECPGSDKCKDAFINKMQELSDLCKAIQTLIEEALA